MESRFAGDFSQVRVHSDSRAAESARALASRAYAIGRDIVFGAGEYAPRTEAGKRLLAHELTHVVQQGERQGTASRTWRILRSCPNAPTGIGRNEEPEACRTLGSEAIEEPDFRFRFCQDSTELTDAGQESELSTAAKKAKGVKNVDIHGYASVEGPEDDSAAYNYRLSCMRAAEVAQRFRAQGIANLNLYRHGPTTAFSSDEAGPNRVVVVKNGPMLPRVVTHEELGLLVRLALLGDKAEKEGSAGKEFRETLDAFRLDLTKRLQAVGVGNPLPADLQIVLKALLLWSTDPGNRWGEGVWDSEDLVLSAAEYATIPASQYKCNAYVAEVLYQSLGVVHKAHESEEEKGQYFPYQAKEWANPELAVPGFSIVTSPAIGDIWSDGRHVGIYLGTYGGKRLYISARDRGDGVFGLKSDLQKTHGIQIKYLPEGGVYRRYSE